MRYIRIFCAAAVATALFLSQAVGQYRRPAKEKYEVSLAAGVSGVSDEDFVTSTLEGVKNVGVDFDIGPMFAFRITDNFSKHVAAELEYNFSDHDSVMTNLLPELPRLNVDQRLHKLSYSAVVYPGDRHAKLRPFGLVGAGATYYQVSTNNDLALANDIDLRSKWAFAWTYGGGLKWILGDRWGLRVDLRNQVVNAPNYGLPRQDVLSESGATVPGLRPDGEFQNWILGAGVTYLIKDRR